LRRRSGGDPSQRRRRRLPQPSSSSRARGWAKGLALVAGLAGVVTVVVWLAVAWNTSRVPGSFSALELGPADYGGGPPTGHHEHIGGRSVAALHVPAGSPDTRIRLVAEHSELRLPSGRQIRALTFNGQLPGPELRVREGELVQVTLVNKDVREGVSIHWHGVDLPNAEDGVAGVTQASVPPGGSYVYRFRASVAGTYWYHSHQHSADEVERGLYGALIVLPRRPSEPLDLVTLAHTLDGVALLGSTDREVRQHATAGTRVRLRLINSSDTLRRFALAGTRFRVVAIDARDKPGGALLNGSTIAVPAGGRYDLAFRMLDLPVRLSVESEEVGLVLDPGHGTAPP
jgi:FtsP/CotA-like multicopper oxidase with cupredoxin domain